MCMDCGRCLISLRDISQAVSQYGVSAHTKVKQFIKKWKFCHFTFVIPSLWSYQVAPCAFSNLIKLYVRNLSPSHWKSFTVALKSVVFICSNSDAFYQQALIKTQDWKTVVSEKCSSRDQIFLLLVHVWTWPTTEDGGVWLITDKKM